MSMSDDVSSAGAENKRGTGLKDPFAAAKTGQGNGQPGTGLPGLAAFGKMQAYAAQAQPAAAATDIVQAAPEAPQAAPAEPAYEEPQHDEAQYAEPQYEQAQPEAAYPEEGPEYVEPAFGEEMPPQPAELAQDYGDGTQAEPADDAEFGYTPEEIQDYAAQQEAMYQETAHGAGGATEPYELSPHMALQAFEARYDQNPEIPLGSFDEPGAQPFFHESGEGDADFLGPDDAAGDMPPPQERKSRRALMFASGLIGALALGGALAFAYKTSTGTKLADNGTPPLIKADDRPVKVTVDEPGGKQFPHQNKKIYDRLQGEQSPEVEKIVPRQEQVASAPAASGLDSDKPMPGAPQTVASAESSGGPTKVRTLQVRPDGSVVVTAPPETAAEAPAAQPAIPPLPTAGNTVSSSIAVTMPSPASPPAAAPATPATPQMKADPTTVASVAQMPQTPPAAAPKQPAQATAIAPAPLPNPKPAVPVKRAAAPAAEPQSGAAGENSIFVVQVASRRSQAMALAAFADLQQKYTGLLGDYQPMIQSADLGNKGVWYRLRVGPMSKKAEADKLCSSLKRAGLRSCLVRPL